MSVKGLVVHPDGECEVRGFDGLADYQAAVGGFIEGIYGPGWSGFANEEGLLEGLPYNELASAMAALFGWAGEGLVGPVVFLGPVDGKGGETDVPEFFMLLVEGMGEPELEES